MKLLVEHDGRRQGAIAEAIDGLESHRTVGGRLPHGDAEDLLGMPDQAAAAHRLAGFRAADLDDMATRRLTPEIMIEGENAMHLGARPVHCRRQPARRVVRDEAETALHL